MAVSRRFKRSIGGKRSRRNLKRNTRKIGGKRSRRNYRKTRGGVPPCKSPEVAAAQDEYNACKDPHPGYAGIGAKAARTPTMMQRARGIQSCGELMTVLDKAQERCRLDAGTDTAALDIAANVKAEAEAKAAAEAKEPASSTSSLNALSKSLGGLFSSEGALNNSNTSSIKRADGNLKGTHLAGGKRRRRNTRKRRR